uniref:Uncharacterized protein n=1 Tax=Pseudomonas aeruginosa TaxID=287 RepID=A0A7S5YC17_PSEAI|nr:hypothetical protein [Pseudomonas aeruginosa]UGK55979.1 Hypothetical protein [Pseudomonas aeruginosa]
MIIELLQELLRLMMVTADSSLAMPKRNGEFPGYPRPPVPV